MQQCCETALQIRSDEMANRIEGVTEKLIEISKKEFLANGYINASMRTISEEAGTTPRSIYTRYGDKEGLFAALVDEPAKELKELFTSYMEGYSRRPVDMQKTLFHNDEFEQEYNGYMESIIDLIYSRPEEYRLLICCAEGTKYASYIDEIVEINEQYTLKFIEETGNDVISSGRASTQLIHLLCGAYMYGFFEVVRHGMNKEEAMTHIWQLQAFFSHGWDKLFNP